MARVPPKPSGKGLPPVPGQAVGDLDKTEPEAYATLNFKVTEAFKIEFKTYAAQHGKSMNRVLQEAFALQGNKQLVKNARKARKAAPLVL
jgi:hypothetical protein